MEAVSAQQQKPNLGNIYSIKKHAYRTKKVMTLTVRVNVVATILAELHLNPRHYDRLNNRNSVGDSCEHRSSQYMSQPTGDAENI